MTLTRKIAYNTLVQIAGKVITTGLSLSLVIILTRYLGVSGYGEYTTIFSFLGFFSAFVDFGLYIIAVREISKDKVDVAKIAGNLLSLRIILALFVFTAAVGIGMLMPYSHVVKQGILIGAISIATVVMSQANFSILHSKLKIGYIVLSDVIGRSFVFGLTFYFIALQYGLQAIILAYIIGNLLMFFISYISANRIVKLRPRFDFDVWKKLISESYILGIAGILGIIQFKIDSVLLSALPLKSGLSNMHEVGIYGTAYKILEVLISFPAMVAASVFPILTKYVTNKDDRLPAFFQRTFDFLIFLATPLVVGTFLLAPYAINILGGAAFAAATFVLQILIFAVAISFFNQFLANVLISSGLQKKLLVISGMAAALNISLNIILIPYFSYIGAAVVTVITELLGFVVVSIYVSKSLKLKPKFSMIYKALVSSLAMGILFLLAFYSSTLFGWQNFQTIENLIIKGIFLLLLAGAGALLYFIVMYLIGGISKDDISALFKKSKTKELI